MSVYGLLCEKPSAARNFAKALGGMSGSYDGKQYVIVAARGHLYEYVDPHLQVPSSESAKVKSWDLSNLPWDERLFSWKYAKKDGVTKDLSTIKNALKQVDCLVCAGDVDPSGEGLGISWEILSELGLLRGKKLYRMYFADESEKEIRKAFSGMQEIRDITKDQEFLKYRYRSQWDMLSMQWTRIATSFANGNVIREGRLKSVMVKLAGDALKAVADYVEKPFYSNKFRDENGVVYSSLEEPTFANEKDVPQVYHASDVVQDGVAKKHTAPPKLIDLAGLSSALAPYGFEAKDVLSTYQEMYTHQICSYPRTEDKFISPEQFNDMLPLVDRIAAVVGVDPRLLTHRMPRKTHVKTGGAHGANRPGPNVPQSLDVLQQYGPAAPMIYEILAKNYLAMLAEDYEYETHSGHVKDYPQFVGTTSVPKFAGWRAIYTDVMSDGDEAMTQGLGKTASPYVAKGVNPKPPVPTMKWMMKQLEKYDVGTGATRTSTYAEVTNAKSKYPLLLDRKGKILMAPCGSISYVLLADTMIGDAKVTERLWQEMKEVAEGRLDPSDGLHRIQDMVRHDMAVMKRNSVNLAGLGKDVQKKMASGNGFVQKEKYTGVWKGEEVSFNRDWSGHHFTDQECEDLLAGKSISFDAVSKAGKPYRAFGNLQKDTYNGREYVGFKLDFDNAPPSIPKEFCKHKFTEDERVMLEAGKRVYIEGMVSKKGNVFNAYVRYGEKDGRKGLILEFE